MVRGVPLTLHTALEIVAAPAIMAAPFLLGFGQAAGVLTFALGAVLLGHAIQLEAPRRTLPLSAHAGIDYALAAAAAGAGSRSRSRPGSRPPEAFWSASASP